jgi:hypothetical protein
MDTYYVKADLLQCGYLLRLIIVMHAAESTKEVLLCEGKREIIEVTIS